MASGANFLVLDEPTNHLDVESREALEEALESFPGTVLLISHDRALLDAVATRTLAVEGKNLRSYDGGWADVIAKRAEELILPPAPAKKAGAGAAAVAEKARPPKRKGKSDLDKIEVEIAAAEEKLVAVEAQLAADWSNADLIAAHKRQRDDLAKLMERWEALFAEAQEEAGA